MTGKALPVTHAKRKYAAFSAEAERRDSGEVPTDAEHTLTKDGSAG